MPLSENDDKAVQIISEALRIDKDKVSDVIKRLERVEVLRRVGSSLRFNPDMKGDIFLSTESDTADGEKFIEEALSRWMPYCPDKVIANIADASRHNDTDNVKKVVCRFIQSVIDQSEEDNRYKASKNLNLISRLVYICPEKVADLISIYLDKIPDISRDDIGQIVHQLLHVYKFQKQSLNFIKIIAQKKLSGMYNNYEAKSLIKDSVSPIETNLLSALDSISELLEWVKNENCTSLEAELACYGASEALAGSHEYRETYGITMTYGRKTLIYADGQKDLIDRFRDKALLVIEVLLFHNKKELRQYALNAIENMGEEANKTALIFERVVKDKMSSLISMAKLIEETDDYRIINKIEDILIRIWANNDVYPSLAEPAEKMLESLERSPEYALFRYCNSRELIIDRFEDIKKDAPSTGRWAWLVTKHFRKFDVNQKELDKIVGLISEKYKTAEEILSFLIKIDAESEEKYKYLYIPIIETWGNFNSRELLEIFDRPDFNKQVPLRYYKGFIAIKCKNDSEFLNAYAADIVSDKGWIKDFERIEVFLSLVGQGNLTVDQYVEYVTKILKETTPGIKSLILHRSYFIFNEKYNKDREKAIDVLLASLQSDLNENVLDMFAFLFSHLSEWEVNVDKDSALMVRLLAIIKNTKKLDYNTDELLKCIFSDDLVGFLDFVEYRLSRLKEQFEVGDGTEHIDPIPYDGFSFLGDLVATYEDFKILMEKIFEWDNREMIYSFDKEHLLNTKRENSILSSNFLIDYINEKSSSKDRDNILRAISALECLDFGSESRKIFLKVLNTSLELGLFREADEVFVHQVITGSYSSTVGEAPPSLINKRNCLVDMQQACMSGEVKKTIEGLLASLNRDIQRHIDDGQERINPK